MRPLREEPFLREQETVDTVEIHAEEERELCALAYAGDEKITATKGSKIGKVDMIGDCE